MNMTESCSSVVIIATVWLRVRSSSPTMIKNVHICMSSRLALGHTQPPMEWVLRALSPGAKRPTSAEVKKMWVYTSTSTYIYMAWCLISQAQGQLCLLKHMIVVAWTAQMFLSRMRDSSSYQCYTTCKTLHLDIIKSVLYWNPLNKVSFVLKPSFMTFFAGNIQLFLCDLIIVSYRLMFWKFPMFGILSWGWSHATFPLERWHYFCQGCMLSNFYSENRGNKDPSNVGT
jgi:hypothetical protein